MNHPLSLLASLPEPGSLFVVGGFLLVAALLLRRVFQVAETDFQPPPKEGPQREKAS